MSTRTDVDAYAGQTIALLVSVTEDGDNKSLTDATAIDFTLDTPTPVTKSLDDGVTVLSSPNDYQCRVIIAASDTTGVAKGAYWYRLWVTDASNYKCPVAVGIMYLEAAL